MQKIMPGQTAPMDITRANGTILLTVLISLFTDGVSITFTNHDVLNRTFRNLAEGRAYLRFLMDEAKAGTPLWLIIEQAGMWTSAAAVADQAEQDLIASINADFDQDDAKHAAQVEKERAAVADIMAGTKHTGGWNGARNAARQIRPTRTNTHCKPLTPAMADLARNHRNGVVTTRPGQSWTLLDGIIQRGHANRASATYRPGTRIITSIRLNARGYAVANQQAGVAA